MCTKVNLSLSYNFFGSHLASMLNRLISHNDQIPLQPSYLTRFHSRAPPTISVRDYLLRITRYTNVPSPCLLILLLYVDRISEALPNFTISSLTVHRFIIAGVACSSKALSDSFCTNGRYARVGGVGGQEMNLLEREFLEKLDWRLTVSFSGSFSRERDDHNLIPLLALVQPS